MRQPHSSNGLAEELKTSCSVCQTTWGRILEIYTPVSSTPIDCSWNQTSVDLSNLLTHISCHLSPLLAVEWKRDFSDGSPNPPWCCALPWLCLWAAILGGACCARQRPTSRTCLRKATGALVRGEVTCARWGGLAYTSCPALRW